MIIAGIVEIKNKSTDHQKIVFISDNLDTEIDDNDIDRSHVIGRHNKAKKKEKRNIIKHFVRYTARCNLFCKKRKLKGTGKSIIEKFTTKRTDQLNDTRDKCGFNVCSYDGKIFYEVNNELKVYYD